MKTFLLALLVVNFTAHAADKVSVSGMTKTDLDFVWTLKTTPSPWTGKLDCQSFFHHLTISNGGKDIQQILDAQECDEWRDKFENAGNTRPLCLEIGDSIKQTGC